MSSAWVTLGLVAVPAAMMQEEKELLVLLPLPILLLRKRKLRHSLGRPSRSDFVQLEFIKLY